MKERLGDFSIFNRWTAEFERATIFRGLDSANFKDFEQSWQPALSARAAQFKNWNEAAEGNVQDAHWDWVGKAKSEARYDAFAIECAGTTQGLMLLDLAPHFARIPTQRGLDICYVELISSAPWNRPKFSDTPKYRGCGLALLGTAVSVSLDLELKGRLGLHSLPESETWYGALGFTNWGFDADKRLQYFEMTAEQADQLLQTREASK